MSSLDNGVRVFRGPAAPAAGAAAGGGGSSFLGPALGAIAGGGAGIGSSLLGRQGTTGGRETALGNIDLGNILAGAMRNRTRSALGAIQRLDTQSLARSRQASLSNLKLSRKSRTFRALERRALGDLKGLDKAMAGAGPQQGEALQGAFTSRLRTAQAARGALLSPSSALQESFAGLQFQEQLRQQAFQEREVLRKGAFGRGLAFTQSRPGFLQGPQFGDILGITSLITGGQPSIQGPNQGLIAQNQQQLGQGALLGGVGLGSLLGGINFGSLFGGKTVPSLSGDQGLSG